MLLIAEAMAVRHTVLSQSAEFKEARLNAFHNATFVYDLLTLATVKWGQVALLQEVSINLRKALLLILIKMQIFIVVGARNEIFI